MKHIILILSLLFCCNIAGFPGNDSDGNTPPPPKSTLRSSQPIASLSVKNGCIRIYFNAIINNALITISDETGMTVNQTTATVGKGGCKIIDSGNWSEGFYIVTITDAEGNTIHEEMIEY